MARERRNHYRVLCLQPDAPPELVKAAYQTLVTRLRSQPDRGGRAERLARLDAAWAVLGDPAKRAAYDRTLPRGGVVVDDPACPFCGHAAPPNPQRDSRCSACDSPLFPAPDPDRHGRTEHEGRRRGQRFERPMTVEIGLPGTADVPARLRDLSLGGLSFHFDRRLPAGSVLRVRAPGFDALAEVAASRATLAGATVHAKLLTLQITPGHQGVVLDARA